MHAVSRPYQRARIDIGDQKILPMAKVISCPKLTGQNVNAYVLIISEIPEIPSQRVDENRNFSCACKLKWEKTQHTAQNKPTL